MGVQVDEARGAELSEDYEERTAIVGYRAVFGIVGTLLVYASVNVLFPEGEDGSSGQMDNHNYPRFALVCSLVMWLTIWISAAGTHKEIPRLPKVAAGREPFRLFGVLHETRMALGNANFRKLFFGVLLSYVMNGVNVGLSLFMFTFFWELDASDMQLVLLVLPVGVLLGTPLVKHFHRPFDKKPAVVLGTASWAALQLLPVVLRLLGFFPENSDPALVYMLAGVAFVQGIGVAQGVVSLGSMVADIVDEQELKTGRRQKDVFFAALSFAGKATSGLGGLVAGIGLDLTDWPRGEVIKTAADVDAEILVRLGLLFGPGVAVFGIAAVWFYTLYRLERSTMPGLWRS